VIRGLRVPVHLTSRDSLRILDLVEIWAARTGHEIRLVSANDHVHSRKSAHYLGLALDFHSSDPDGLAAMLRQAGYRVLWKVPGHYAHVHVEEYESKGVSPRPLAPVREAVHDPSRKDTSRAGGGR
jgi:hypothetical protein